MVSSLDQIEENSELSKYVNITLKECWRLSGHTPEEYVEHVAYENCQIAYIKDQSLKWVKFTGDPQEDVSTANGSAFTLFVT